MEIATAWMIFDCNCFVPKHWDVDSADEVRWFSVYGISTFTYMLVGLLMMTVFDGNYAIEPPLTMIPQAVQGMGLCFQSFATGMADVNHLGKTSVWHLFDRLVATTNVLIVGANLLSEISWVERLYFVALLAAGLSLLNLSRLEREGKPEGSITLFARYHAEWHLSFPLGLVLWMLYRQADHSTPLVVLVSSALISGQLLHAMLIHTRQHDVKHD